MFTGVPNLVWVFGYFRASWTLRVDLLGDFVCRLLDDMKKKGFKSVTPRLRPEDEGMPRLSWIDPENFNPNYLQRSMHLMPKRGDKPEWQHTQDYWREKEELPAIDRMAGSEASSNTEVPFSRPSRSADPRAEAPRVNDNRNKSASSPLSRWVARETVR